jgi:hypothetical protein
MLHLKTVSLKKIQPGLMVSQVGHKDLRDAARGSQAFLQAHQQTICHLKAA